MKLQKIKICHICDRITGQSDGVYTHMLMLLNSIDKNRFEQIVVFQGGEIVEKELKDNGIKVFIIPELNKRVSLKGFINIYKILRNEEVDIIQAHLIKPYILTGLMNILLKKKLIFNYHGLFLSSVYHNFLERLFLQIIHFIIVVSRSVQIAIVPSQNSKHILEAETKIFPRVEVYYNGFSPRSGGDSDKEAEEELVKIKSIYFVVGIVARLETQKRIDYSLRLLKSLIDGGYKVFFVYFGDGPLEEEMRSLSEELSINKNCRFFGYVKDAHLYIKYFDTILFTSDWEGMPLTFWEAMANSVPIISTDVGGAREILTENDCGLIYRVGNVDEGVKSLIKFIENAALRLTMGKNGEVAIQTKYSNNSFNSFFENLYNDLMTQRTHNDSKDT